jgi:hypothetical protein
MKLERLGEEIREVQARVTNLTEAAPHPAWTPRGAPWNAQRRIRHLRLIDGGLSTCLIRQP